MYTLLGITLAIFIIFFLYPYLNNLYNYVRLYLIFKKVSKNKNPEVRRVMENLAEQMKELIKQEEI